MLFVCFQSLPTFVTTETLPWSATLDRGSVFTGVPEVLWVASSFFGRSPPQFETYTFSPTTRGVYGATPTGTRARTPVRVSSSSSLPRDEHTHRWASSRRAMPVG